MAVSRDDIAKKAGVGAGTVSRVFNNPDAVSEKTRKKVLKVAEKLGYKPDKYASALRRGNNGMILFLEDRKAMSHGQWRLFSWYWASAVRATQHVFDDSLYHLSLQSFESIEDVRAILKSSNWAAVILNHIQNKHVIKLIAGAGLPYVLCGRDHINGSPSYCLPDDVQAGKIAGEHLQAKGYQNPLYISGVRKTFPHRQKRYQGIKQHFPDIHALEWKRKNMMKLVAQLPAYIQKNNHDAIFFHTSTLAVKCLPVLQANGLNTPKLGIISCNNAHWLNMQPTRITTIDNNIEHIFQTGAKHLIENMNSFEPLQRLLQPKLIQGETT